MIAGLGRVHQRFDYHATADQGGAAARSPAQRRRIRQKKNHQYTRLLTFPLAIIQSIGSIYLIRQAAQSIGGIGDITANTTTMQWVLMVAASDRRLDVADVARRLVTEQSVGNGISLLITGRYRQWPAGTGFQYRQLDL